MTLQPLLIDGSLGEGGGQVLRSSLALALLTSRPFTITNIRRHRARPGLLPQHLRAAEAAAAVGMARLEGAMLGSQSLFFEPAGIRSGGFHFDIGTAGSTSLVLQTVLPPLSFAGAGSTVTLTGGTHVPRSPCFHFLDLHWLHFMRRIGFSLRLRLETAGFYPRGGGRVHAEVRPVAALAPLCLVRRGPLQRIRGISAVANLDVSVAERQKRRASEMLGGVPASLEIEILRLPAPSPGTFLLLLAEFEGSQCCFCGLGARGKPAERVAEEAAAELLDFLRTDGAIDPYLADQLILPLALVPGLSELRTSKLTQHLATNAEVVKMFLPVAIEVDGKIGEPGTIRLRGGGLA
jgi:RNA 3'-terminal phosphate cyclase (ATP)